MFIHSFNHSFSSLSYDRPKASSKASSPHSAYPLLFLRSSSSFLRLLPRLTVTSIPPFIFPSITRCRRQFLGKIWTIQLAFRLLISCRIFLCSLTLSNTSSFLTRSVQLIFSILHQDHISKLSRCFWSTAGSVQVSAPCTCNYKDLFFFMRSLHVSAPIGHLQQDHLQRNRLHS